MNLIAFFPRLVVLKKYPKISGYLDRISKIWIMKKFDIQSIQVSKYPCIQRKLISIYPSIHISVNPRYPSIRLSKYPKKNQYQYQKKVVSVHPYTKLKSKNNRLKQTSIQNALGFYRLVMKGKFDTYVLWPFRKKLIS